ncbi:MAG TPA: porin [Bacteroidetes bacterium]|nr:porin [Bacteroidota bacterium]
MKNYLVEFIGTFFLVLVIALSRDPIAIGAILMVMVYMGGHISGAQYNPAVTLAVWMNGAMKMNEMIMYMIAQVAGAVAAAVFYYLLAGRGDDFYPHPPGDMQALTLKALAVEAAFTFALVMVVLNVAVSKKTSGNSYFGLAIGFTIMAAATAGGKISGGAYNPAVATGPMLFDLYIGGNGYQFLWIYIVGPFSGAIAAAMTYKFLNAEDSNPG